MAEDVRYESAGAEELAPCGSEDGSDRDEQDEDDDHGVVAAQPDRFVVASPSHEATMPLTVPIRQEAMPPAVKVGCSHHYGVLFVGQAVGKLYCPLCKVWTRVDTRV